MRSPFFFRPAKTIFVFCVSQCVHKSGHMQVATVMGKQGESGTAVESESTYWDVFRRFQQIVKQFLLAPGNAGSHVCLGVGERSLAPGRAHASNASKKTEQVRALLVATALLVRWDE